ncbi:3-dehydroquinate synthase [Polyangium aurulentum]|uniref:3-dehydroquinate synthase family protein n=1 Tax=Polyangium aurulentum TaxID=2567896 RepID=UPI00146E8059|nr:3-dehydroquinate synthase [Polyangium aurulentum]UQA61743.1 3-dehydroquinate synthase [Polyangium aurulentum]
MDRGVIAASREIILHIERYAAHHHAYLDLVAPPIVLDGGETLKDDGLLLSRLQSYFHALELDRRSVLLAVGGASLLDLAGFASATMRSAPRVIRLPTTTLAQAGPAVLPASSINAFGTKDFLGTQRPPFAVLCDRRFLDTQRPRDKVAGLTQAVRAALLWDAELFGWISAQSSRLARGERDAVAELVRRGASLYAARASTLGAEDEDEASEALAHGTWSADRLSMLADRRIRSGEALAIGIALDAVIASLSGLIAAKDRDAVVTTFERLGLRLWHDALGRADSEGRPLLLDGLSELCGGRAPRVPLLAGIGGGVVGHALRESVVREAIEWLSRRDAHRAHAWALA